jgi:hypothetical protein
MSLAFMTTEVDGKILLLSLQVKTSKNHLSLAASQPLTSHMTVDAQKALQSSAKFPIPATLDQPVGKLH